MEITEEMEIYMKLCLLKEKKKIAKDPLYFLLQLSYVPLQFRVVRFSVVVGFVSYIFSTSLTLHMLITTFDHRNLLQYGSSMGLQIFMTLNLATIVFKFRQGTELMTTFTERRIPLEIVDRKVYAKMMIWIPVMKILTFALYVLGGLSLGSLILSPDFFNKRSYLFVWICKTFPTNCETTVFLTCLLNVPIVASLIFSPTIMSYSGIHAIFQTTILNEMVKKICCTNIPSEERNTSKLYQKIISQKLKMCVSMHNFLIEMLQMSGDLLYEPIILISIGSVILGSAFILEYYTLDMSHITLENFGILCFALDGLLSAGMYITIAQLLKDKSEETHYILTQLPWYSMSAKNLRTYTIFLRQAEKPLSLVADLVEVNFLLIVRIFRALYSLTAVLAQVVNVYSQVPDEK